MKGLYTTLKYTSIVSLIIYVTLAVFAGIDAYQDVSWPPHWFVSAVVLGIFACFVLPFRKWFPRSKVLFGSVAAIYFFSLTVHVAAGMSVQKEWEQFVAASHRGDSVAAERAVSLRDKKLRKFGCVGMRWFYDTYYEACVVYDPFYNPIIISSR